MKRRIVIIGSHLNYNLEHFIYRAFERLNHEVKFIGFKDILGKDYSELIRMISSRSYLLRKLSTPLWLNKLNKIYLDEINKFNPDLVLSIKGETVTPNTLNMLEKNVGVRTALWFPDDPRFFNSLVKYIAPRYSNVFSCSSNAIENYRALGIKNISRIPFGCDPEIHDNNFITENKINKAIFIGTYSPKRYRFIKSLIRGGVPIDVSGPHWPSEISKNLVGKGVFGKNYVNTIKTYSAVINLHQDINYGPNMRAFEVTGSGGILITDRAEDILSFFSENSEILVYNDNSEAQTIIKNIINGNINTEKMARNAHHACHTKFTYDRRAKEILDIIFH